MIDLVMIIVLSYVAGSVPTSIVVGRVLRGIDIRQHGSGNAGATNVLRVLGWKPALVVVVVDVFKGFAAAYWIAGLHVFPTSLDLPGSLTPILAGMAAVLGHTYTVFAGFRGGKGVGTAAGMLIALFPLAVLVCLPVFVLVIILTGYVSLGSMLTAVSLPLALLLFQVTGVRQVDLYLFIFSLLIPLFIIFTHRSNIKRLLSGSENRFDKARIFVRNKP
jgi:glycerol-3-phosphate acyltransferase PlsY